MLDSVLGEVYFNWRIESCVAGSYSLHCTKCNEKRNISEKGLSGAISICRHTGQANLFPKHICKPVVKPVDIIKEVKPTAEIKPPVIETSTVSKKIPIKVEVITDSNIGVVNTEKEPNKPKERNVSGLVAFLSELKGLSASKFTLIDVSDNTGTVVFKWKCNSCGTIHLLNEYDSVLVKTGMFTCMSCIKRGISTVDDIFIGLTLGTYEVTKINADSKLVKTKCIHCGTERKFSFEDINSMIEYNKMFKHYKDLYCDSCVFSTNKMESVPYPKLRKSKIDSSVAVNGNIIKYKFRQSALKADSNVAGSILLDISDMVLTTLSLTTRTNDSVAIQYVGSTSSLQLNRYLLNAEQDECAVYKNGLIYDLRRGNLIRGKKLMTKYYKYSQGVYYYEKERLFRGKLLDEVVEGTSETEVLLKFRELECRLLGEFAYNPAHDFSGVSDATDLIFQGVSEEDLVKLRLTLLAQNPWLCFRYNLFDLLDKYGIHQVIPYKENDSKFICNELGIPFVYLV